MKVVVLRGIPGSGKSTLVQELKRKDFKSTDEDLGKHVIAVSADHYFMKDGSYKFDPRLLSAAHTECFRNYLNLLTQPPRYGGLPVDSIVVVDNTNITAMEISPYVLAAGSVEVPVIIHNIFALPEHCLMRNIHKVPDVLIFRMFHKFINEPLAPWWKQSHSWQDLKDFIMGSVAGGSEGSKD